MNEESVNKQRTKDLATKELIIDLFMRATLKAVSRGAQDSAVDYVIAASGYSTILHKAVREIHGEGINK